MTSHEGRKACYVAAFPDWEGVEELSAYLELNFAAECVSKVDGPDARCWTVRVGGATLQIQHDDPWGNMIVACGPESDDVLSDIAADIERHFGGSGIERQVRVLTDDVAVSTKGDGLT